MSKLNSVVDDAGFWRAAVSRSDPVDIAALASIPLVLVGVSLLPVPTRESFVFETAEPTVRSAYASHFVHRQQFHLLGNVFVYLVVAPVVYLLCLLSDRRQLFRVTFVMLVTVFPLVLSVMQLLFPREREILGFSGLNAGLFGLLCVAWVLYTSRHFVGEPSVRFAPTLLFLMAGVIAFVTLPARAWRLEITAVSLAVGFGYLLFWAKSRRRPTLETIQEGFERFGYAELAGAGLGLILCYPLVGFRPVVTVGGGVLDAYIHLLGYSLAFIIVYAYVAVIGE